MGLFDLEILIEELAYADSLRYLRPYRKADAV